MAKRVLKTIIQLRRDNDYNYEKIKDVFVPLNGEVVLVDTAKNGLRSKVGDGVTTYANLPFTTSEDFDKSPVVRGYYYNGQFYSDSEHTKLITGNISYIYIDATKNKLYTFDGTNFVISTDEFPTASETVAGAMKLYTTTGQNTDGTMTQKAITDGLSTKFTVSVSDDNDCLIFS